MYLTQQEMIKYQLTKANNYRLSGIIKSLIDEDKESQEKLDMIDGVNYYAAKHEILKHDFQAYYVDGIQHTNQNKSNNRIINAYHKYLIDQKVGFMVGNPVTFKGDDEAFIKLINDNFSYWFNTLLQKWIRGASNRGKQYVYCFINQLGDFDYTIIPGEQVIPVYDTQFVQNLVAVIRYYQITQQETPSSPKIKVNKVEIYDSQKVYYLVEKAGQYIPDPDYKVNPSFHIYRRNTQFPQDIVGAGWGRVPFVELKNNDEGISDLKFTKSLIDAYDFNLSSMNNNLADIAKAIWVLKGYEGTKLSEFMYNLNAYNAIKVDKDGGVEPQTNEIPDTAHNSNLDRMEDNIFIFGFGVNPKIDKQGLSPSGISLEHMYAGLDIKSNIAITETTSAIHDLLSFLAIYYKITKRQEYNPDKIEPIFDKHLVINETELIDNVQTSLALGLSRELALAHHPWVKNISDELKAEEAELQNNPPIDFNNPPPNSQQQQNQ